MREILGETAMSVIYPDCDQTKAAVIHFAVCISAQTAGS